MSAKSTAVVASGVTLHSAAASLPAPTSGVSIAGLRRGAMGARDGIVVLEGSQATVSIAAPIILCGKLGTKMYKLATLNKGALITVTDTLGYAERVFDVGVFDELALTSGTITNGTVTVKFVPIEVQ